MSITCVCARLMRSASAMRARSIKLEVVKFSTNTASYDEYINLMESSISILPQAKYLRYIWDRSLSAKSAVKDNISRARKLFFALGSTGCYLGRSNVLTAKAIVETCMLPTLLYGAENWILNDESLRLLESFQAEIGRRILRLSKRHSQLSVLLAFSWPSMKARILCQKLSFLCRILSSENDIIATRMLPTLASQDVYRLGIVQQCIALDSKLGTDSVSVVLNNVDDPKLLLKEVKNSVLLKDKRLTHQTSAQHQSVRLAIGINWLRFWEAARDRGPYRSRTAQSFFKLLTSPIFEDHVCLKCSQAIPTESTYIEHLIDSHNINVNLDNLISELN